MAVIHFVQKLGFKVVSIIRDNNRINQTMFSIFGKNNYSFDNPSYPGDKIFMLYDTVHLIKNVRNNWINKNDADKIFHYPHFETNCTMVARFEDIRTLDSNNFLKRGFKLNHKPLYPTVPERQNVQLTLNIFDPTTIAALISANNVTFSTDHKAMVGNCK